MNTVQLIIRAFSMTPDYYQKNRIGCWIILGINLLGVLAGIINTFRRSRAMRGPRAFLYIVLRVLLLFGALTFGIMLLLASEVAEASPEQFNFGFYIEIIVASILLVVFLYRKTEKEDSAEDDSELAKDLAEMENEETSNSFLSVLFVVPFSVIFMIFGNGMIRWGFSLFGKKVGAWFFGLYAGWAVGVIFDLLKEVTDFLLYGLRDSLDDMPTQKLQGHKEGASNITIPNGGPVGGKPAGNKTSGSKTSGSKTSGSKASGSKTSGSKSPRSKSSEFKDGLKSFFKTAAIYFIAFIILSFGAVAVNHILYPAPKMPADHVMVWNDSVLESKMREITGIYSGDIWLKDVWEITELRLGRDLADYQSMPVSNLHALGELKNLKRLFLDNSEISDISALGEISSLTHLSLGYNRISDISPLSQLSSLYYLNLSNNSISDISPLADLHSLNNLSLWENQISDISPLADLTSLNRLDITGNQISDISSLARLTSVQTIFLSDNFISDISVLAGFKGLDRLIMDNNQITSVAPLKDLKHLTYVNASGNPLTDAYILQEMNIEELYL